MNNTEPLDITQDPNMLDDVVRFFDAQIQQDEKDGIRSPFLSTFDVNRNIPSWTAYTLLPSFTAGVDSYISLDMEPSFTTQRTTFLISDWFESRKGYRALKTGWHVVEFSWTTNGNLNGTYGLRLGKYFATFAGTRAVTSPRIITNGWSASGVDENSYKVCIYLKWGEYFIFQLYVNGSGGAANINWSHNIVGRVKVLCIEDKFITWQI